MTASLAASVLRAAIARRQPTRLVIVPNNCNSQYCSRHFHAGLKAAGPKVPVDQVASADDTATMKSFDLLLQDNLLNLKA